MKAKEFRICKGSNKLAIFLIVCITIGLTLPVNAQEEESTKQFKIDFFKMFDSSSNKLLELAEAIPSEYYDWQPTEKIRSIKGSLLHVASANYYLGTRMNFPIPEGINPREFEESVKTKKAVQEILSNSIEHIRGAIQKINDEQLYTKVNFFGGEETKQRVIFQVAEHIAEHLGQLIVYARLKDITPPWSQ